MMTSGAVSGLGIIQVTECMTRQNAVNEKKTKLYGVELLMITSQESMHLTEAQIVLFWRQGSWSDC